MSEEQQQQDPLAMAKLLREIIELIHAGVFPGSKALQVANVLNFLERSAVGMESGATAAADKVTSIKKKAKS